MGAAATSRSYAGRHARTPVKAPLARPSARRDAESAARNAFGAFVLLVVALTALGLLRVSLTARVAESTIRATELRKTIKTERAAGELLEADKCALTTPSRIEAIAGESMKMVAPREVRYMELGQTAADTAARTAEDEREAERAGDQARSGMGALLSAAMDVAAGGTQVLLVGDVGLTPAE